MIKKAQCGFTLIEICIALIITGLLSGAALAILGGYQESKRYQITREHMDAVSRSLAAHVYTYNRLPCPAAIDLTSASEKSGREENCFSKDDAVKITSGKGLFFAEGRNAKRVVSGAIPWRDLNLKENEIKDGWGANLTYAVTAELTSGDSYAQTGGGLFVSDQDGHAVTKPEGGAQYVLIAHGPDQDNLSGECEENQLDDKNCDGDGHFVSTDLQEADSENYFDDVVDYAVWIFPPASSKSRDCSVAQLMYAVSDGSLSKKASDFAKTGGARQAQKIPSGQMTKVCADKEECVYFLCKDGEFVKGEIDLDSILDAEDGGLHIYGAGN